MKRIAITTLAAVLLAGCEAKLRVDSKPSEPAEAVATKSEPCPEEAFVAVLHKLFPVLGSRLSGDISESVLQEQDRKIACIRDWSASLTDLCIQANYIRWLDHYSREVESRRKELSQRGTVESDTDKYNRERAAEAMRVAAYERSHPVPKPPSCDMEIIRKVKP